MVNKEVSKIESEIDGYIQKVESQALPVRRERGWSWGTNPSLLSNPFIGLTG